ncbi:hypothetical protein DPMN_037454 [Dreissena polymorpha]|uniref:Uncharacterized protein n=1 Tax=Dreissena polymorpha TaxID=45954 RepID=A0A9D4MF38_DREPO|nr:hypothetical protein DPMN_037454 [Dreissena polymorpha]
MNERTNERTNKRTNEERSDERTDTRKKGRTEEGTDILTNGRTERRTNKESDGRTDEWTNRRTKERMRERTKERTNRRTNGRVPHQDQHKRRPHKCELKPEVPVPIAPAPLVRFVIAPAPDLALTSSNSVPAEPNLPYSTKHYRTRKLKDGQAGEFWRQYNKKLPYHSCN